MYVCKIKLTQRAAQSQAGVGCVRYFIYLVICWINWSLRRAKVDQQVSLLIRGHMCYQLQIKILDKMVGAVLYLDIKSERNN